MREVFVTLYEEGLIYRGNRIINWCPRCHTAISDIEVEYHDEVGADEVIYLNQDGALAEGSRTSVFVERGGVLQGAPGGVQPVAGAGVDFLFGAVQFRG